MNRHLSVRHRLGWRTRGVLLVVAAGLAGLLGLAQDAGAGPAWLRHAPPARAPALCVRDCDRSALSHLRHDHGFRVVHPRSRRPIVASEPGGVSVRAVLDPSDGLVGRVRGPGRGRRFRVPDRAADGPAAGQCGLQPHVLVDPFDGFTSRFGRPGAGPRGTDQAAGPVNDVRQAFPPDSARSSGGKA